MKPITAVVVALAATVGLSGPGARSTSAQSQAGPRRLAVLMGYYRPT